MQITSFQGRGNLIRLCESQILKYYYYKPFFGKSSLMFSAVTVLVTPACVPVVHFCLNVPLLLHPVNPRDFPLTLNWPPSQLSRIH